MSGCNRNVRWLMGEIAVTRFRLVALSVVLTSAFWLVIGVWLVSHQPADQTNITWLPGQTPGQVQRPGAAIVPPLAHGVAEPGTVDSWLLIPVAGARTDDLVDSFARSGALEIPAPAGVPVIAAAPGIVEKLSTARDGSKTIRVRSPDRMRLYQYALLGSIASGLSEGQVVGTGDQLGSVGSAGKAGSKPAHLRFEVLAIMPAGDALEDTRPINPYPLLGGRPSQSR